MNRQTAGLIEGDNEGPGDDATYERRWWKPAGGKERLICRLIGS